MSRFGALFVASILSLLIPIEALCAQPKTYRISPMDSRIGFVVTKWVVFKEEGRFKHYDGTITYDAKDPSATHVSVSIQTSSVDSRNTDRDQVIKSNDLLDVNRFPTMIFKSTSAQQKNRDTLLVSGDFTIRNITKRITVPVAVHGVTSVQGVGELAGFETEFVINRFDYGVSAFGNLIDKDVVIQMQIGAIAK